MSKSVVWFGPSYPFEICLIACSIQAIASSPSSRLSFLVLADFNNAPPYIFRHTLTYTIAKKRHIVKMRLVVVVVIQVGSVHIQENC